MRRLRRLFSYDPLAAIGSNAYGIDNSEGDLRHEGKSHHAFLRMIAGSGLLSFFEGMVQSPVTGRLRNILLNGDESRFFDLPDWDAEPSM